MMQKVWRVRPSSPSLQRTLVASLKIQPLTAQILINRGVSDPTTAAQFLNGGDAAVGDPRQLLELPEAVARIRRAIAKRERILVYGDYDVDGLTGTALLVLLLRRLDADVTCHIPNRLTDGYGLNDGVLALARHAQARLLITVDCGTTSHALIGQLATQGVETIVLDHHQPGPTRPDAVALVNPTRVECPYPNKGLASVGLAWKVAQALCDDRAAVREYLDLVALGTVADVSPLTPENRWLIRAGLAQLAETRRLGLRALLDVARLGDRKPTATHLGFGLAPRLNAAGRLSDPGIALRLLLSDSAEQARELAEQLEAENQRRQRIERQVLDESLAQVERTINFQDARVIVLAQDGWHPGVIGIVAARLVERFYRPAIVVAFDGGVGKGSGRSVRGFHLTNALRECGALLAAFGGHSQACGLTILRQQLAPFTTAINRVAQRSLDDELLQPALELDAEVGFDQLNASLVEEIERLEPFGPGNPRPLVVARGVRLRGTPQWVGKATLKWWLTDGRLTYQAVAFRWGTDQPLPTDATPWDVAFTPSMREWRGERSLQLEVKDLRPV